MSSDNLDFQTIYTAFRPKILRYLTRMVGAPEAEDLTQEVLIKVSKGLQSFRGESQLSTWIYRIATNAALDNLRRPSIQRTNRLNITSESEPAKDAFSGETASADHQIIRNEMNECIRNFVENLPEDYRTVVVLKDLEDLTNDEIADVLDVTLDTVKIRLHRARARLRKELEGHCTFYRDERNHLACDVRTAFDKS